MAEIIIETVEDEPQRPWSSAEISTQQAVDGDLLPVRSKSSLELLADNVKFEPWSLTEIPEDRDNEEELLKIKYGGEGLQSKSLKAWLDAGDGHHSDEYDTDLEDEIPEVKLASVSNVDPTGALYYSDICDRQGLRPVSFLLRNMNERHVRMRSHYITPDETKLYTEALQRNTVTETLDLADNYLGEEGTQCCCDLLKDNMFILNLDLSMNFIGREGLMAVVSMLDYNNTLTTLTLSGNQLTDAEAVLLGDSLKQNHSIACLNLSHNKFGDQGGVHLAAGLVENHGVQDLDLSWNGIRERGAVAIVNVLKTNRILEVLDLSWNGLSTGGAEALGKVLRANDSLKVLDISNNRIGGAASAMIAAGLGANTGLETLWMDVNPCGSLGVTALLKALNNNETLRLFSMEKCVDVTLEVDIYLKVKELQAAKDIIIIHSGMGGYNKGVVNLSIMSLFARYLEEHRGTLEDVFNQLDRDQNKRITVDELKLGLKANGLRMTNKQIDILMSELDHNRNATIEYDELLHGDLVARTKELAYRRMNSLHSPEPENIRPRIQVTIMKPDDSDKNNKKSKPKSAKSKSAKGKRKK